jgi:anti-anti-sigma factor
VESLEILDDASGVRVIVLSGEHDISSAAALRHALAGARKAGLAVVIELTMVSFIDSTILAVIVGALRDFKEDGRGFAVVASPEKSEPAPRLLGIAGMRAVFPVFDDRSVALDRAAAGHNTPGAGTE